MIEMTLLMIEKSFLLIGIGLIFISMIQYGKRSQDWKGLATIFYKRVEMSISEFKYYKLGVSLVVFAVVLRILFLTLWP
ncbi:hypothetical protein [Vibrio hibernica]|uniref:hypothetical protein n=1 Tax=Vibrio hibernica TaxID=2587465 RepID=UPI00188019DA|nr:hypothetical protein [Vibrio hibernica]